MRVDTLKQRDQRPFVFTDMRRREGLDEIIDFLVEAGGLSAKPLTGAEEN